LHLEKYRRDRMRFETIAVSKGAAMSKIDISGMTRAELRELIKSAKKAAETAEKPDVAAFAARVLVDAKAAGIARWALIHALQGESGRKPTGVPVALKGYKSGVVYRDPASGKTWVGRIGGQPRWIRALIQSGMSWEILATSPTPLNAAQIRDLLEDRDA
jgi:DNA-binding protein H-NS